MLLNVAPLYPIISRELILWWNIMIKRRMKAITLLACPWKICFSRNMAQEVFDLLKLTILKGNFGNLARSTQCIDSVKVTLATAWILHVIKKNNSTVQEEDIFFKRMKDSSFCKGIILPTKPPTSPPPPPHNGPKTVCMKTQGQIGVYSKHSRYNILYG
jgi:hypothetical protein